MSATLAVSLVWLSVFTQAQHSFTDYSDVQHLFASLTDVLPPELKSSSVSARGKAWLDWVIVYDRDIRSRLQHGDEDTIVNWLMFGTSFTKQPRALLYPQHLTAYDGLSRDGQEI